MKSVVRSLLPARLRGRLRSWRVQTLIRGYQPRVVEHRYGSGSFKVHLADPLAEGWYDRDWAPLPEIEKLKTSRLKPGATVFDLGAHQGVVAMMLAREVAPTGRVVAVEACAHNVRAARENARLNGMSGVEVLETAVSDRTGTIAFNVNLNGQLDDGTGKLGRVDVPAITIDSLTNRFGPPDVVFIDIEGAESKAMTGAKETLKGAADFFIEMHVGEGLEKLGGSVEDVIRHFPETRYQLLMRAEPDAEFRAFEKNDPITRKRFYLIALVK